MSTLIYYSKLKKPFNAILFPSTIILPIIIHGLYNYDIYLTDSFSQGLVKFDKFNGIGLISLILSVFITTKFYSNLKKIQTSKVIEEVNINFSLDGGDMDNAEWFYMNSSGEKQGPYSIKTFLAIFKGECLPEETLVCKKAPDGKFNWIKAGEDETLRPFILGLRKESMPLPVEGEKPPIYTGSVTDNAEGFDFSKKRPGRRFWAKYIDIVIAAIFGIVIGLVFFPSFENSPLYENDSMLGLFAVFFWVFFESFCLATFGTTIGKVLLGIKLRHNTKNQITLSMAFKRSFGIYINGLGIGFPIVYLCTLAYQYNKQRNGQECSWDTNGGFIVGHTPLNGFKVFIAILIMLSMFFLTVVGILYK